MGFILVLIVCGLAKSRNSCRFLYACFGYILYQTLHLCTLLISCFYFDADLYDTWKISIQPVRRNTEIISLIWDFSLLFSCTGLYYVKKTCTHLYIQQNRQSVTLIVKDLS